MDARKIIQRIIIFLVFQQSVSSLTMHTENVVAILQDAKRIILNCTYENDTEEIISDRNIRWKKQIKGVFKDLALFSPPGGQIPFIYGDMQSLYSNRTELIAPNSSLSAVMIIKDPVCSDEGIYQCWIDYFSKSLFTILTSNSTVEFRAPAKKPGKFTVSPNELDENQSITLNCSANVGGPPGNIQIWKIIQYPDTPELIYTSDSKSNITDSCQLINVTTTYIVTKKDHGAIFRCSSKNILTQGPEPRKESSRISVLYGPDMPAVTMEPLKSVYSVGDSLTINCISDSNPPPVITWSVLSENKSEEQIERFFNKSKLVFRSLQPTDSGNYTCTATNAARPKHPNITSVPVFVRISKRMYPGCNHCGDTKICNHKNGRNECILNIWIPIAVVFIISSATFLVTSIMLIILRRTQENTETNNMLNTQRAPLEVTNVAYSEPRVEIRIHENSSLLPHNNELDGYTTTEDVVQYAAVQKKSAKDNQVSNDNVYESAWNSDDVFFNLRPETQGPHRSPEQ